MPFSGDVYDHDVGVVCDGGGPVLRSVQGMSHDDVGVAHDVGVVCVHGDAVHDDDDDAWEVAAFGEA